jgi:RNA polymerase sigma-70 factor (ECF subfamily)
MHLLSLYEASSRRTDTFEKEALPWTADVFRFALSLTRDESEAEDVVQDTYLRAFRSWHTYVPGSDCRRWLFTICRNVFLRSRERMRPTMSLDGPDADWSAVDKSALTPRERSEDGYVAVELRSAIGHALAALPEPFRSAVLIVDVRDQPYEVAAEMLGVPVGTIRSRLFRGRRMLQTTLRAHAADAGLVA